MSGSIFSQVVFWAMVVLTLYLHYRVLQKAGLNPFWALVALSLLGPVFFARTLSVNDLQSAEDIKLSAGQWLLIAAPAIYVIAAWRFAFARWPAVDDTPVQRPQGPLQPPSD